MLLADAFIQNSCIQAIHFLNMCVLWVEPTTFCATNAQKKYICFIEYFMAQEILNFERRNDVKQSSMDIKNILNWI